MRFRSVLPLLLTAACSTQPAMRPPSVPPIPPPPPPQPPLLQAIVSGHIVEPAGNRPAEQALVTATVASVDCSKKSDRVSQLFADVHGNYQITVEAGVGPELVTCVIVEATLGGSTGTTLLPAVWLRAQPQTPQRYRADITLPAIPRLTQEGAEELIQSFVKLLNHQPADELVLSTYVREGPEGLRTAKEDYQALLGEHIRATIAESEFQPRNQRVSALLRGDRGGPLSISIYQDELRRFHSPLVDYSLRARHFMSSFARTIMANDPERLARLLTADDIDFPVEEARRIIEIYRPDFEVMSGQYELLAVDEQKHTLRFRETLRGEGREKALDVVLGYGDGLLWLVEVRDHTSP